MLDPLAARGASRAGAAGRDVGLVIYDECHHAAADDNLRVLRQLGAFEHALDGTLLGFTATTARGDGKGLDKVFERIVYSRALPEMIEDGYLAPLRGFRVSTTADLRGCRRAGLDFDEEELAEAVDIEERNALVARSIQELARDRRTIAFCVTVNHARNLAHALNVLGVPGGHRARRDAGRRAREGACRLSRGAHAGAHQRGRADRGLRRSRRVVHRDGAAHALGGALRAVRGPRHAAHPGKKDCLILDFVDLSTLSLCTLPSLFGAPRDLDLRGGDANEARRAWQRILFDHPGFELEAGAVTLAEIQDRAASFDPLTLRTDDEVRAISGNAWFSLGRHGLGLHFQRGAGRVSEVLVLRRAVRGKGWEVVMDGQPKERFSRMEEAVEAVDYEIRAWAG